MIFMFNKRSMTQVDRNPGAAFQIYIRKRNLKYKKYMLSFLSLHAGFTCVCRKTKFPPVYEILSVKVWVFFLFIRNGGYFDIAFLKGKGAIAETYFIERFIAISTIKIQKEFSFRILLVEIWLISWEAHFSLFPLCLAAIFCTHCRAPSGSKQKVLSVGLHFRPIEVISAFIFSGTKLVSARGAKESKKKVV
jgi:hypothetical protein